MRCPHCACQIDKVIDSRVIAEGAAVRRRRECSVCGYRFTTHEEIIAAELKVIKRDSSRVEFDQQKIRSGVEKACWKRKINSSQIDSLVTQVTCSLENDFEREVSSEEIGRRVMAELRKIDKVAYVRFASVYRDFKDIDEFVSEIQNFDKK